MLDTYLFELRSQEIIQIVIRLNLTPVAGVLGFQPDLTL